VQCAGFRLLLEAKSATRIALGEGLGRAPAWGSWARWPRAGRLVFTQRMADTSVLVCATRDSGTYLLHSSTVRASTRVLQLDPWTGDVVWVGEWHGQSGEQEALMELARRGDRIQSKRRACAMLGLLIAGSHALLFLATKVRQVALPHGSAFVVLQSDVYEATLSMPRDDHNGDLVNEALLLSKYPLDELSFYSATLDLSLPYRPPFGGDFERMQSGNPYVWNDVVSA
jgi:hypothetical protein